MLSSWSSFETVEHMHRAGPAASSAAECATRAVRSALHNAMGARQLQYPTFEQHVDPTRQTRSNLSAYQVSRSPLYTCACLCVCVCVYVCVCVHVCVCLVCVCVLCGCVVCGCVV